MSSFLLRSRYGKPLHAPSKHPRGGPGRREEQENEEEAVALVVGRGCRAPASPLVDPNGLVLDLLVFPDPPRDPPPRPRRLRRHLALPAPRLAPPRRHQALRQASSKGPGAVDPPRGGRAGGARPLVRAAGRGLRVRADAVSRRGRHGIRCGRELDFVRRGEVVDGAAWRVGGQGGASAVPVPAGKTYVFSPRVFSFPATFSLSAERVLGTQKRSEHFPPASSSRERENATREKDATNAVFCFPLSLQSEETDEQEKKLEKKPFFSLSTPSRGSTTVASPIATSSSTTRCSTALTRRASRSATSGSRRGCSPLLRRRERRRRRQYLGPRRRRRRRRRPRPRQRQQQRRRQQQQQQQRRRQQQHQTPPPRLRRH